jgi:anti-sigma B factor antagonist
MGVPPARGHVERVVAPVNAADTPALRITEEPQGSGVLLRLAGELDLATADQLRRRMVALTDRRPSRVVVDVGGLEFLDVTGLIVLLEAQRDLAARGAIFALRRPRAMVLRLLRLLQLADVISIED